jgi:Tol biopolymer transport system component
MSIWSGFANDVAPETGRKTIQLTKGDATCYPLYYFIPTFSDDGRYLVYHRAEKGDVQIHALDLASGDSIQLTHAKSTKSRWIPWCVDSGTGVLDHRSVLDTRKVTGLSTSMKVLSVASTWMQRTIISCFHCLKTE